MAADTDYLTKLLGSKMSAVNDQDTDKAQLSTVLQSLMSDTPELDEDELDPMKKLIGQPDTAPLATARKPSADTAV